MFVVLLFTTLLTAKSEYRAFELRITNNTSGKTTTVKSTLDQNQYAQYHPQPTDTTVEYVSSWMCVGRTDGFMPICAKPEEPLAPTPAQKPAGQDPALQSPKQ